MIQPLGTLSCLYVHHNVVPPVLNHMVINQFILLPPRVEWAKLKEIYKQLQKKQMSQLKETMKEKKDTRKKVKQDITTEDATNDPAPVSESHDPITLPSHDIGITVEITMCTLSANDLEVSRINQVLHLSI